MGQFGEQLRREREARGVSLEIITHATKISSHHLHALEADRFDLLPGGVFNKSIVRGYARVVGLDEEEWVRWYLLASNQDDTFREDDPAWIEFAQNVGRSRGKDPDRPDNSMRWAGVGVLLLLVFGLSWFVWNYVQEKVALSEQPVHAMQLTSP